MGSSERTDWGYVFSNAAISRESIRAAMALAFGISPDRVVALESDERGRVSERIAAFARMMPALAPPFSTWLSIVVDADLFPDERAAQKMSDLLGVEFIFDQAGQDRFLYVRPGGPLIEVQLDEDAFDESRIELTPESQARVAALRAA